MPHLHSDSQSARCWQQPGALSKCHQLHKVSGQVGAMYVLAGPQVMHVLELEMPPSGCLAPGASATLKVTFKPLVRRLKAPRHAKRAMISAG